MNPFLGDDLEAIVGLKKLDKFAKYRREGLNRKVVILSTNLTSFNLSCVQARGKEVKMHLYEDNHPLGKEQKRPPHPQYYFRL